MVEVKVFEKYYSSRPLKVKIPINNFINVHINKVTENNYGDVIINCYYYDKDKPKFLTDSIILFFTKNKIVEQSKIFSIDGYITVKLNKL